MTNAYQDALQQALASLPPAGEYITCPQAAERLGVTTRAIQQAIQRGKLPAFKMGRLWRIREDDAALYVRRRWRRG